MITNRINKISICKLRNIFQLPFMLFIEMVIVKIKGIDLNITYTSIAGI